MHELRCPPRLRQPVNALHRFELDAELLRRYELRPLPHAGWVPVPIEYRFPRVVLILPEELRWLLRPARLRLARFQQRAHEIRHARLGVDAACLVHEGDRRGKRAPARRLDERQGGGCDVQVVAERLEQGCVGFSGQPVHACERGCAHGAVVGFDLDGERDALEVEGQAGQDALVDVPPVLPACRVAPHLLIHLEPRGELLGRYLLVFEERGGVPPCEGGCSGDDDHDWLPFLPVGELLALAASHSTWVQHLMAICAESGTNLA